MTDEDKTYIIKNLENKTIYQIAEDLDRNVSTIRKFCKNNKLSYKSQKSKMCYTDTEIEYIKSNIQIKTIKQIAEDLGRNYCALST